MKLSRVSAVAVGALALALVVPTSAPASPVVSDPIVSGLVGPLQIDLGHHGKIYVAQAFSGVLTQVNRDGTTEDLTSEPTGIDGVASGRRGVAYTTTDFAPATRNALLKIRKHDGTVKTVADLWPYEQENNPDQVNTYGFLDLSAACAAEVDALPPPPDDEGPPPSGEPYTGQPDSHPYALANDGDGGWYVADAGMNAIVHVTKRGKISTVAVLPAQPFVVTSEAATRARHAALHGRVDVRLRAGPDRRRGRAGRQADRQHAPGWSREPGPGGPGRGLRGQGRAGVATTTATGGTASTPG